MKTIIFFQIEKRQYFLYDSHFFSLTLFVCFLVALLSIYKANSQQMYKWNPNKKKIGKNFTYAHHSLTKRTLITIEIYTVILYTQQNINFQQFPLEMSKQSTKKRKIYICMAMVSGFVRIFLAAIAATVRAILCF